MKLAAQYKQADEHPLMEDAAEGGAGLGLGLAGAAAGSGLGVAAAPRLFQNHLRHHALTHLDHAEQAARSEQEDVIHGAHQAIQNDLENLAPRGEVDPSLQRMIAYNQNQIGQAHQALGDIGNHFATQRANLAGTAPYQEEAARLAAKGGAVGKVLGGAAGLGLIAGGIHLMHQRGNHDGTA